MSWYVKILIVWVVFLMVGVSIGIFIKRLPKVKNKVFALTMEKQDKLVHSWLVILKLYKLVFILLPIGLVIVPYALYRFGSYQEFIYGTLILILAYLVIFEDYMLEKRYLRKSKIGTKRIKLWRIGLRNWWAVPTLHFIFAIIMKIDYLPRGQAFPKQELGNE